jgi:hypothetical protein
VQEQVFFMPTGETAGSGEGKLIFLEQNHHYYLQELWTSNGGAVPAGRTAASANKKNARVEIALSQDRHDKMVAGK